MEPRNGPTYLESQVAIIIGSVEEGEDGTLGNVCIRVNPNFLFLAHGGREHNQDCWRRVFFFWRSSTHFFFRLAGATFKSLSRLPSPSTHPHWSLLRSIRSYIMALGAHFVVALLLSAAFASTCAAPIRYVSSRAFSAGLEANSHLGGFSWTIDSLFTGTVI